MYLPGVVPAQGVGCTCSGGGVYLPRGCTYLGVVYLPGGVPTKGCTCPGGVFHTFHWGQTDTYENIAFANVICGWYLVA